MNDIFTRTIRVINSLFSESKYIDPDSIGCWIENRPYVWLEIGPSAEDCKRLYLVYDSDKVYPSTSSSISRPEQRGIEYSKFKYGGAHFPLASPMDYEKLSMLDIWARNLGDCDKLLKNYFNVYVPERDGPLKDLDIRVQGRRIRLLPDDIYKKRGIQPDDILEKNKDFYLQIASRSPTTKENLIVQAGD